MPLVLTLTTPSSIPLEVDTVRLENLRAQSSREIESTPIQRGNQRPPLAEFFRVSGSAAEDNQLVWEGDCSNVKLMGAHLSDGQVRVVGNAGMHVGAEMTGGEVVVEGDAGDFAGAEMHGGRIRIQGNAGQRVGSVYIGGRKGMTGGEILISGSVGKEMGHAMRRGLIAVSGNAGDFAGLSMLAGTILVFGKAGVRYGAGMRRGTIGLLAGADSPELLPTFKFACTYRPTFLNLYLNHLRRLEFDVPAQFLNSEYHRYSGDLLEGGRGEILVRAAN